MTFDEAGQNQEALIMVEKYITVITGSEAARIKLADIMLIEKDRRKIHMVTQNREYHYYDSMEHVETFLDQRFYPCLKNCYVNLDRISCMAEQNIYFDNGYVYNLGRTNFIKTRQKYRGYLTRPI